MGFIPSAVHSSWESYVAPLFEDRDRSYNMTLLKDAILPGCVSYPQKQDIFNVFRMPLQDIKV